MSSEDRPDPDPSDRSSADDVAEAMRILETEVHQCERCPLSGQRTNAVPGEGATNTVVMFVGEGPGADEDRQGRPFVGRSGQFLTRALQRLGISREEVYITNVVKCRPPENRDPLPQELEACSDYLERQVALINPRIIVTLGRFSMRRWFPAGSITRIHGKIRNIGHGRVAMAMFHPAAALRHAEWQTAFEHDLQRLPALIARARAANEAAVRGEGLPAGVPHPGDPDYIGEEPAEGTAVASETVAPDLQSGRGTDQFDGPPEPGMVENNGDASGNGDQDDIDFKQLSLL
jgi:uracil-DNA glycosylase family 4